MKPDDLESFEALAKLNPDELENLNSMWDTIYVVADDQFTDEQILCAFTIAYHIDDYGYPPVLPNGLTPVFVMAVYGSIAKCKRAGFEIKTGADMDNMTHHAFRFYANQRKNASKPRGKTAEGITIKEIIMEVMGNEPNLKAKELWPHLWAALDKHQLEPEDLGSKYMYDGPNGRKPIAFHTFENKVTEIKKSR